MIRLIDGLWSTKQVFITGMNGKREELKPARSLKVRNHSPGGFNWSYTGSGPAQLALAILLELVPDRTLAEMAYQQFKTDMIATLPADSFELPGRAVQEWIDTHIPEELCTGCQKGIMRGESRYRAPQAAGARCEACGDFAKEAENNEVPNAER